MTKTDPNMAQITLDRFESMMNLLILRVAAPTDNEEKGQQFQDHFVGNILEKRGKALKDKQVKVFKKKYADNIKTPTAGNKLLESAQEVELFAKVSAPRNSFDLDEFIKTVAEKYELSQHSLRTIADNCTKQSAAPVSFITSLVSKEEEDNG